MEPLFIRLQDGQPVDHPIPLTNLRAAFPHVDPENPSPDFAKFVRVQRDEVGKYKVATGGPTYQWIGDVVQDVWETRDVTQEEREVIDRMEEQWP